MSNPVFRIGTVPGFAIFCNVPEERTNSRTGKTYIKQIGHSFEHRDKAKVEARKAELEAEGFTVKGVYECLFNG